MAVPQGNSTLVLYRDRPDRRVVLGPQYDVRFSAVSPDGRWVVTCSYWVGWPLQNHPDLGCRNRLASPRFGAGGGQCVRQVQPRWPLADDCRYQRPRQWEVGTWREVRRFERGNFVFSPDSRLLAINDVYSVIRLLETTTGREVARLTGPDPTWYGPACFTPDGTRLVATCSSPTALYVWDLRLIRQQLKELGLDWDWPDFPPADHSIIVRKPRQVEVLLGDLGKPAKTREQKARHNIERYRRAIEANPDDAAACNNLAWQFVTAPEALRDVNAALPLAEKAVRLEPERALYRNTLGVAYYRAGRYREAVEVLRANLDKQEDAALAFDLYFLAMSHHRLDETARARDYFDWAMRWTLAQKELSASYLEELNLFRAEAGELMRIDTKKD